MSPEEELEKYADQIFEAIFNQYHKLDDSEDNDIIEAAIKLHDTIRCQVNIQPYIEAISCKLTEQPHFMRIQSLKDCFTNLLAKVTPRATWRCFGNILVHVGLMRALLKELNMKANQSLQHYFKSTYLNFVVTHFTEFIYSMGGFADLPHYVSYSSNNYALTLREHIAFSFIAGIVWCATIVGTYLIE